MSHLFTLTLQKAHQRYASKISANLQAAAAKCLKNQDAEWWGASVLPQGDAFLVAEAHCAEDLEAEALVSEPEERPAQAAMFLLFVSYALH